MQRIGPYQVTETLGQGGMAVVYRAQGPQGETVALKVLHPEAARKSHVRQRFQLEANALSRLSHPNLVRALGAGEHGGTPWLALEFVDGTSLQAHLLRHGPLPIERALDVVQQLTHGVSYAHSRKVLHRDLKPDNVLLRGDEVLLTDFGLAFDQDTAGSRLSTTGVFLGTPGYWSPEQALGKKAEIGPATDVYGLGAVLYACLTGQAPQQGSSLGELLSNLQHSTIPTPRALRPEVPEWLNRVCMRCLAEDPAERPASPDELGRALRRGATTPLRTVRLRGWLLPLLTLAAVALTLSLLISWAIVTAPPPSETPPPTAQQPAAEDPADPPLPTGPPPTEPPAEPPPSSPPPMPPPAIPPRSSDPELNALLDRADALAREDKLQEALAATEAALRLDPDDPTATYFRGVALSRLGRRNDALAVFTRLVELVPYYGAAHYQRGKALIALGRYSAAAEVLYEAAHRLPSAEHLSSLGYAYELSGESGKALQALNRALVRDPTHFQARANRAKTLISLKRYAQAADAATAVLRTHPDHLETLYNRGLAFQKLKRLDESLADFDRALGLAPNEPSFHTRRGEVLLALGRLAESIEAFTGAIDLARGNSSAYANRGAAKLDLGQPRAAIEDFTHALRLSPRYGIVYANRATALIMLREFEAAIADCDRALEIPLSVELTRRVRALRAEAVRER